MSHTRIVQDMNDTVEFCHKVSENNIYSTYRPLTAVVDYRNYYLHKLMHYTKSTPLY